MGAAGARLDGEALYRWRVMSRRWRTPADWICTRRQMRPAQLKEPGTCAACGSYLLGGIRHWHYTLRWISGFREPRVERGRAALDVVLSAPPELGGEFVRTERAGIGWPAGEWVPRSDGKVALRLRREDLPR